jgi:hypothetical protein
MPNGGERQLRVDLCVQADYGCWGGSVYHGGSGGAAGSVVISRQGIQIPLAQRSAMALCQSRIAARQRS